MEDAAPRPAVAPTSVTVVPTEWVMIPEEYEVLCRWSVKQRIGVLRKQGLIEPICVYGNWRCRNLEGAELLEAARQLGWATVIVVNAHPNNSN